MLIGYARVSTNGQNLDGQIDRLRESGCDRIFEEVASGVKSNRPVLKSALDYCRPGDTIVCLSLSRIARSVRDLLSIVEDLEERGIEFRSLTETIDTSTPMGKMFLTICASFSQLERDTLIARTKIGLEAARQRGRVGGRPRKMSDVQIASAKDMFAKGTPAADIASAFGVSVPTLYRTIPAGTR